MVRFPLPVFSIFLLIILFLRFRFVWSGSLAAGPLPEHEFQLRLSKKANPERSETELLPRRAYNKKPGSIAHFLVIVIPANETLAPSRGWAVLCGPLLLPISQKLPNALVLGNCAFSPRDEYTAPMDSRPQAQTSQLFIAWSFSSLALPRFTSVRNNPSGTGKRIYPPNGFVYSMFRNTSEWGQYQHSAWFILSRK